MPRILIVDDDADLVQLLTVALKTAHHEVASAGDPVAGMQAARTFRPDIILLDYHLPGTNGAHLFESFRRNQATLRTPILFMSGEATPQDVLSQVAENDRSRFINKPVRISDLQNIIHEMLEPPEAHP